MTTLKHKVTCAICGKTERIKIVNGKTPKPWLYFGRINVNVCQTTKYWLKPKDPKNLFENLVKVPNECYDPKVKRKYAEYWECQKCDESGKETL